MEKKTSVFGDDWQEMSPNRRISSKSWVGCTYFYPVEYPANAKARIMAMTLTVDREPPRGLDAVTSILGLNPVPDSVQKEQAVKPPLERRLRSGRKSAMFEFCCSPDSKLGQSNLSRGVDHIRLSKDQTDLENPKDMQCLLSLMDQFPGADLWASIPCGPWSPWQRMNVFRYGRIFKNKIEKASINQS